MMNPLLLGIVSVFLMGCNTLSYLQSNPGVVTVAARHAIYRYITAGEEPADRARQVVVVIENSERYLAGNPTATPANLLEVVVQSINWDSLTPRDRLLIEDLFSLIEARLAEQAQDVPSDAVVKMRVLMRTIKETAGLF